MGLIETASISPIQRASADFYGKYFWKNYKIQDDSFLNFVIDKMGIENIMKSRTLLDVGAGSGKFSILLKRRFPHLEITAADLSIHNIRTIQENASRANVKIELSHSSALDLPFPAEHFDLVLCVYMLQHTQDPATGFSESARVLKPGGTSLYAIGRDNCLGKFHRKSRCIFNAVPVFLRRLSVLPVLPLYWALTHLLKKNKASYRELSKDLVDWIYNPLQNFIPEVSIRSWFESNRLRFNHLGYTGLFKSMLICRGYKR